MESDGVGPLLPTLLSTVPQNPFQGWRRPVYDPLHEAQGRNVVDDAAGQGEALRQHLGVLGRDPRELGPPDLRQHVPPRDGELDLHQEAPVHRWVDGGDEVRGGEQDAREGVQLLQNDAGRGVLLLVGGLLHGHPPAEQRVRLVDEDDGGEVGDGLDVSDETEEVPKVPGFFAEVGGIELGAVHQEEVPPRRERQLSYELRLARPGRSEQDHRNATPKAVLRQFLDHPVELVRSDGPRDQPQPVPQAFREDERPLSDIPAGGDGSELGNDGRPDEVLAASEQHTAGLWRQQVIVLGRLGFRRIVHRHGDGQALPHKRIDPFPEGVLRFSGDEG